MKKKTILYFAVILLAISTGSASAQNRWDVQGNIDKFVKDAVSRSKIPHIPGPGSLPTPNPIPKTIPIPQPILNPIKISPDLEKGINRNNQLANIIRQKDSLSKLDSSFENIIRGVASEELPIDMLEEAKNILQKIKETDAQVLELLKKEENPILGSYSEYKVMLTLKYRLYHYYLEHPSQIYWTSNIEGTRFVRRINRYERRWYNVSDAKGLIEMIKATMGPIDSQNRITEDVRDSNTVVIKSDLWAAAYRNNYGGMIVDFEKAQELNVDLPIHKLDSIIGSFENNK